MKSQNLKSVPVKPSEITPEHLYMNRRKFISSLGFTSAAAFLAACAPQVAQPSPTTSPNPASTLQPAGANPSPAAADEPLTDFEAITNFNNFYEFSFDKEEVAPLSEGFKTSPWNIQVGGLVNNPLTLGIEDLSFPVEERIYRMRCVEGWSMVIPWLGFSLNKLLAMAEPTSAAKFVAFQTLYDTEQFPNIKRAPNYPWPYTEGLRLDEAMHDLTILSTGLYGKELLPQNGAPLRLVVPWKYGFKSIKSIVKIDLVDTQPATLWNTIAPNEYGFYSNVNPEKAHPRWSQATEYRIGEQGRMLTLMFNGYAGEVAALYDGMDLQKDY